MAGRPELSDEQWEMVEPVLRGGRRADNRGHPWHDTRSVLNGVLWVLGTGAQWRELPEKYSPFQTCHRRFQQWIRSGKLEEALRLLATQLHEQGELNLHEAFVDATFASAKKGGAVGPTRRGKGTKIVAIVAVTVFLSPYLSKALRLPSVSLWKRFLPKAFLRNSGPAHRRQSLRLGPARSQAPKRIRQRADRAQSAWPKMQNPGRTQATPLSKAMEVERLFAWMHNFRRLVTRWEYHVENFLGFVRLACLHMMLKHL